MSALPPISACLIVRDGAATIERAIASVRPHVAEVCVYDTGSTDETLEILERLAAGPGAVVRVEQGEWRDDFAWAREQSFAMVSQPWALWLDDDDIVVGGSAIPAIVHDVNPDVTHVYVQRREPDPAQARVRLSWRTYLLRIGHGRWEGEIHEVIEADDELAFVAVSPEHLHVFHARANVAGRHDHAAPTYAAVAKADVPARLLTHAAQELMNVRRVPEAEHLLRTYLERTTRERSPMRLHAYERLATCLVHLGRVSEANEVFAEQARERADWAAAPERWTGLGSVGPRLWDDLEFESPPAGSRNSQCRCGSGRTTKTCGGVPVPLARPAAQLRDQRDVA